MIAVLSQESNCMLMEVGHKSDWGLSYAITIFTSVKDLNLDYIQI